MIVIVKGIEIMMLGILIEDAHVIGSLIMTVSNLNRRGTGMVKGIVTMSLKMIVDGITNLSVAIGMQTLIMTLSNMTTMSIMEDEGSMIMEMTITINTLTKIGWKVTTIQDVQHLNHVKRREIAIWIVNLVAQRDLIPGSMIIRTWALIFLNFIGARNESMKQQPEGNRRNETSKKLHSCRIISLGDDSF
ncbi:helix-turn-helix domain-containing protein [Sesbania bispinosa]|nr:helix-turn-helix domain-containing protein [Sesbania bispinosa]